MPVSRRALTASGASAPCSSLCRPDSRSVPAISSIAASNILRFASGSLGNLSIIRVVLGYSPVDPAKSAIHRQRECSLHPTDFDPPKAESDINEAVRLRHSDNERRTRHIGIISAHHQSLACLRPPLLRGICAAEPRIGGGARIKPGRFPPAVLVVISEALV